MSPFHLIHVRDELAVFHQRSAARERHAALCSALRQSEYPRTVHTERRWWRSPPVLGGWRQVLRSVRPDLAR